MIWFLKKRIGEEKKNKSAILWGDKKSFLFLIRKCNGYLCFDLAWYHALILNNILIYFRWAQSQTGIDPNLTYMWKKKRLHSLPLYPMASKRHKRNSSSGLIMTKHTIIS